MTEQEWLASDDPDMMLDWLSYEGLLDRRRACLFALACCRRIWSAFSDSRSVAVIETVERFVEGNATAGTVDAAKAEANVAGQEVEAAHYQSESLKTHVARKVCYAAASVGDTVENWNLYAKETAETVAGIVGWASVPAKEYMTDLGIDLFVPAQAPEKAEQCRLLRDIFGNPFRPLPPVNPLLRTLRVLELANAVYAQRIMPQGTFDPQKLVALAAALEEVGCTDQVILGHLREPGAIHVRGCWVVDWLLNLT